MPTIITPLITDAGLNAAVNAKADGVELKITHIVLGMATYTPSVAATAILSRKEKVTISSAAKTGPGAFLVSSYLGAYSGAAYNVGEIGFYAGDPDAGGTLFAVHSQPGVTVFQRNSLDWVGQFALLLTRVPAGSVSITVDPTGALALALLADHEAKLDPHAQYIRHFAATAPLPTVDRGPIWHGAFETIMTWQSFTANGANYIGYASVDVGRVIADSVASPRNGKVSLGASSLSKTGQFTKQMWNWAMHCGLVVPLNTWAQGTMFYADNGDGTYRAPDVRGEFFRFWDNGRGADPSRPFGSWQVDMLRSHYHDYYASEYSIDGSAPDVERVGGFRQAGYATSSVGGPETRSRNTAVAGYHQL